MVEKYCSQEISVDICGFPYNLRCSTIEEHDFQKAYFVNPESKEKEYLVLCRKCGCEK